MNSIEIMKQHPVNMITMEAPKYIQFSDHIIAPRKSSHFHIFMGNDSQQSLLNEMENWPTYYPYQLSSEEVVEEMMSH